MSAAAPRSGLQLSGVSIALDGRTLLTLDTEVAPGEVLTVMGPSGSGKSTLLAFVAGFLDTAFQASGRVLLDGRDITELAAERRGVGLLFQDPLLVPHLSVAGNLLLGLAPSVQGRRFRAAAAAAGLREVGLAGFGAHDPATLSGGQAARVALMRTLLSRPAALLLDEPFSRLDTALRAQIRDLTFTEARWHQLPVLLVTHDHADAEAAGGRIIHLK